MLNLVIGIATCGRPDVLKQTLNDIARQTRLPDQIVLSPIDPAKDLDLSGLDELIAPLVTVVTGKPGLTSQRNTILNHLSAQDVVLFLDDDFVMHESYGQELMKLFESMPEVAGHSGRILADGVNTGGIEFEEAVAITRNYSDPVICQTRVHNTTYGSNMAFRVSAVKQYGVRFDENLPLYGWFEDLDFSFALSKHAQIINSKQCMGVHMGVKSGRSPGFRLGYSQVVNPFYIARKGNMSAADAFSNVYKRFLANLVRSFKPEPWVDRRGRLMGNLKGLVDLLTARSDPKKILEFDK